MADEKIWDTIIVGAGPAGLTAGLYAGRARMETLILEAAMPGGQIATTGLIENYPGFPDGISGPDLVEVMEKQTRKFGAEIENATVQHLRKEGARFVVETNKGPRFAKTVIAATGANPKKLGVPGEEEYAGRGVSYCAVCDGAFFKEKQVVVVGGGDSALDEGNFLTRFAKVVVVHRRDTLRAEKILQERAFANPKMSFIYDTVVESIQGDDVVRSVTLRNVKTGEKREFSTDGVFVYIGMHPNSDYLQGLGILDDQGYADTDARMQTKIAGLYVVGDLRAESARQIVSSSGDGATAAIEAQRYIESHSGQLEPATASRG